MLTASQLVHNFLEQNKANFLKLSPKFYDKNGYEKELLVSLVWNNPKTRQMPDIGMLN